MLTSGLNALSLVQPTTGSTVNSGVPLLVEVVNDLGESYTTAEISIASASGNLVINVPVGTLQSFYLPCDILGQTSIVARTTEATSNRVLIVVNPNYQYADVALVNPCLNPCGPIACPPRASRRSRRGCGFRAMDASSPVELKAEDSQ